MRTSKSNFEPDAPTTFSARRAPRGVPFGILIVILFAAIGAAVWQRSTADSLAPSQLPHPENSTSEDVPTSVADLDMPIDALGQVVTATSAKRHDSQRRKFDPANDGWPTEEFVERIHAPLSILKSALAQPESISAKAMAGLVTDGFVATGRPESLVETFRRGPLIVQRSDNHLGVGRTHRGAEGLAAALRELRSPLEGAGDVHAHFKTIRVELDGDRATTRLLLEVAGHRKSDGKSAVVQLHAVCDCHWRFADSDSPRLASIRLSDYEEARIDGKPWMSDLTSAVLSRNSSYGEQLCHGLNHWLGRIERSHDMDVYGRHGMAVGDVNGDGLDDVYLCQPGGLPNRLFVQNADGTATDRSAEAGVDLLDRTASALFVDLDNDGRQDLVVATFSGLLLMQNNGQGSFALKTTLSLEDNDVQSLSAADYDNDGDLDLYVCTEFANLARYKDAPPPRFVYHDANDGGKNVLFRNDIERGTAPSAWVFTDVTAVTGLDADNRRHSLAAAWEDFDNDGDPDLYVANDYGQNCLYRNDRGRFTNVAAQAGVTDYGSGMSVAWGDIDRDGWMDLYIANMFSSAGSRITRQTGFMAGIDGPTREIYQRFAKGNSLFANQANGTFREIGADAGVEMGRWAWSSLFADINNDGWEDLLVTNGYITGDETDDL